MELKTLVLDPTYTPVRLFPLRTITWQAAISRVLNKTCIVVSEYDEEIKCRNHHIKKPAVIVRKKMVPRRGLVFPTKEAIYYRDSCSCQYCGKQLFYGEMTLDHVVPESKGGRKTFENLVSSCEDCNSKKGDESWKPLKEPFTPDYWEMIDARRKFPIKVPTKKWAEFLEPWPGGINVS